MFLANSSGGTALTGGAVAFLNKEEMLMSKDEVNADKAKVAAKPRTNQPEVGERSFTIIIRLKLSKAGSGSLAKALDAIAGAGGDTEDIDVVESTASHVVRDITIGARDPAHSEAIVEALKGVSEVQVVAVSDVVFLKHLGGKITITPTTEVKTRVDLAQIYTPEVARVCMAIHADPEKARNLTIAGKTVAVVSDGSRVLALGNIGAKAALPVMEGKAVLFKRMAGVDAFPICLDTQDADGIVAAVKAIAPNFAAINLEDIESPKCYEVERRLRECLDIPVFHDDQHGTAVVVGAAALNAARYIKKPLSKIKVVAVGTGAAGMACIKMLLSLGVTDIIAFNQHGAVYKGAPNLSETEKWLAERSNPRCFKGTYKQALKGRDLFLGLSVGGILSGADLATMSKKAVVFALANPMPEVSPQERTENVAVMATGSSKYANQINNALAFPGIFRGAMEAGVKEITEDMCIAAARAIADLIGKDQLDADYIIPTVLEPVSKSDNTSRVALAVASSIKKYAAEHGLARRSVKL